MSSSEMQNLNNSSNNMNNLENSQNIDDNKENINNNNDINETETNRNKLLTSQDWIKYFKQSKINLEEINNALLSNVESIDNENIKLKEALNELIKDLKEKEDSLDESLNIISKLKNNYSNLFHQYQALEKKYIKLTEENEQLKLEQNFLNSKKNMSNESQKNFKDEINRMKKDEINMKNNLVEKKNENMKLLKENAEIKALFEDMKNKNLEYLGMIKDREDLISEYTNQIKTLDNEINNKNEQIKLLVKFSKSINDENKTNVKELTKQACQTIKLFYNNQNNINNNENVNKGNGCLNEIIKMILNSEDVEDLKLSDNKNINQNKTKNFKIALKLKDAILNNISFDDIESGNINGIKEYLINIFIKINLLKLELFSSYIREFHYVEFLNNLIQKINYDSNSNYNLLNLRSRIIEIKSKNEKLLEQNNEMTIKLFELKNKVNELNLYIKKLKNDFVTKNNKVKEKLEKIINIYENKIDKLNDKIALLYKSKNSKKLNNNHDENINNLNLNIKKNIFNYLRTDKTTSFYIINKSNIKNINIKPNKNINQRKNFNFSLNNSIESNQNQNINTNLNKLTLKDSSMKKIENEKLKEEISHLRGEIKELVQDINKQQKLISESNFQTKNYCDKCDFINNLISKSILPDMNTVTKIKNIIMNSSFDEKIKNIIYIICDFINKLLKFNSNLNSIDVNEEDIITISSANKNININSNKEILFFSDLNKKLFSSSELKKYHLIYSRNIKNIGDLIKIFEKRTDDINNKINNIKLNFDSTITEENNISINNKKLNTNERVDSSIYDYKNISDEIIKLKQEKVIIDNTIELIKNFLVMNEKIFYFFIERKHNVEQFKQYSKKIFNIFKKSIFSNLEDTSDNNIFLKKLITKLLEENFFKD